MKIIQDKAQQKGKHTLKENYWKSQGIEVLNYPLPFGDYILVDDKVQDVIDRKESRGVEIKKMDFIGTYKIVVDTKKDIQEIVSDICGKQHDRFRDELILANNNDVRLYILVEDDGGWCDKAKTIWNEPIRDVRELHKWKNPRLFLFKNGKQRFPTATKGVTLMKACLTLENKYGCRFLFCSKNDSGAKVIELLTGDGKWR